MVRQLVVMVMCLACPGGVNAQNGAEIPAWLAQPDMLVAELPPLLDDAGTMTDSGLLRVQIDAANGDLLYQYDEGEIGVIPLPDEFTRERAVNDVTIVPDGRTATICNRNFSLEDTSSLQYGQEFVAVFEEGIVIPAVDHFPDGRCQFNVEGYNFSWEMVSPDGQYRVYVASFVPTCAFHSILVQSATERRVAACTDYQAVEFMRWTDDEHLLMRFFYPQVAMPAVEDLHLLSAPLAETISLGRQIELYPQSVWLFDQHTRLIRIAYRDHAPHDPYDCALSRVDLTSRESVDIEPTYCLHDPQIQMNEARRELLYLNYQIEDHYFHPTTTLHRVDLDTLDVTPTSIHGTAIYIRSVDPAWQQLSLIVDDEPQTTIGPIGSAGSYVSYLNPRWMIYDLDTDTVLFEKPLLENLRGPLEHHVDYAGVGPVGFEWTDRGWRTLFVSGNTDSAPLFIESVDGVVTETALTDLPRRRYYIRWSEDDDQALVLLDDASVYLFDPDSGAITRIIESSDEALRVTWYNEARLLVETADYRQLITRRWLLEPAG